MRVIKPAIGNPDDADAKMRLAAEMLCIEHGACAIGPDLKPLPAPHKPWPVVEIPPLTEQGLPYTVHYRPTVGIVYYTAGNDFIINRFVEQIANLLNQVSDKHLHAYRAISASPSTVMRHKGRTVSETLIVASRKCYKKPVMSLVCPLPSRLLQWTPPDVTEIPLHYSIKAGFTWVFMPVSVAFTLGVDGFNSMASVNAVVSAVFYDHSNASIVEDGKLIKLLRPSLFKNIAPPPFLKSFGKIKAFENQEETETIYEELRPTRGAILIENSGKMTFIGHSDALAASAQGFPWPLTANAQWEKLPTETWNPENILLSKKHCMAFVCVNCLAPIGGDAIVMRNPRKPKEQFHNGWVYNYRTASGELILDGGNAKKGLLLCPFCWNSFESSCLVSHMKARLTRTVIPFSQSEVATMCPGYERLAPVLSGRAVAMDSVPGAFIIITKESEPRGAFILTIPLYGKYPTITNPRIAGMGLPVITNVPLIEVRRHPAAHAP